MTQKTLRLILGDQLSRNISSLSDCEKDHDILLMCEVWDETKYVKHHKKKIAFLFSAMRHFARDLEDEGYNIDYIKLTDEGNSQSFKGEVERAIKRHDVKKVVVTSPGEYRVLEDMRNWADDFNIEVEIRDDDRFVCTIPEFKKWAKGRKELRMEYFYREMRKKTGLLIVDGNKPEGGDWNYDKENRKPLPKDKVPPATLTFEHDAITKEVLSLVAEKFDDHFGDLEPFHFAVTRAQALEVLDEFISERLPDYGAYQDAMKQSEPFMYHSLISFYLNSGLLDPMEVCKAAEDAYHDGRRNIPINAAEGFIRQIIGWREYIRGIYWTYMPEYKDMNALNATRKLPDFFWTGETDMNCLRQCITETKENAYAHHIQRLMVTGNFSLIAGFHPDEVNEWYLIVYADAYEWVELPNVTGMILYADGGVISSKPYAAGSNYINKMSDYCKNCKYSPSKKTGEGACPFNYLYWDFVIRNRETLKDNQRMGMMYATLDRMDKEKVKTIQRDARDFLNSLT
jgi:deoxyribodipyrimidine photolyase-related protein